MLISTNNYRENFFERTDMGEDYIMNGLGDMKSGIENSSVNKNVIRLFAPVIGVIVAVGYSAKGVSNVAETIIKGLGNILGGAFGISKNCSISRGVEQLTFKLAKTLVELPFQIATGALLGVASIIYLQIYPKGIN